MLSVLGCVDRAKKIDSREFLYSMEELKKAERATKEDLDSAIKLKLDYVIIDLSNESKTKTKNTIKYNVGDNIDYLDKYKDHLVFISCSCPGEHLSASVALTLKKHGFNKTYPLKDGSKSINRI